MIDSALTYVVEQMNQHLRNKLKVAEDKVFITSILNQDGSMANAEENVLLATLINVQEEKSIVNRRAVSESGGGFSKSNPPVSLNLFVLFSASFSGRLSVQGLRFLSLVVGFFQANKSFDGATSPGLDSRIQRLNFEIHNLNFMEQSNIWSAMGAKYMPSVLYKVRMLTVHEEHVTGELPMVEGTNEGPAFDTRNGG